LGPTAKKTVLFKCELPTRNWWIWRYNHFHSIMLQLVSGCRLKSLKHLLFQCQFFCRYRRMFLTGDSLPRKRYMHQLLWWIQLPVRG